MAISQATLLISSKHDLLFIAAECLQGSMVCLDGYLCDRSPLFPARHIEFCRSALNFPWAAGLRPGGQFQLGCHSGKGKSDRISLCQNYISVRRRRPLCMPLMDCSFFRPDGMENRWHHGCGNKAADSMSVDDCSRSIKPLICAWTFSNAEDQFWLL